jgi:hypothetical protein
MGWIFVLIASFCGYQYLTTSPTVASGIQTVKSVANSVQAVSSSAKSLAGAGIDEAKAATDLLPADVKYKMQSAAQQVSSSLPSRTPSLSGCGQPDATGNLKYCFNQ